MALVESVIDELRQFYASNPQIKESHGLSHALKVFNHAKNACSRLSLPPGIQNEILIAALLHDVDDQKYFPSQHDGQEGCSYVNARQIMKKAGTTMTTAHIETIISMIDAVSCSKNGNSVPEYVAKSGKYYYLIPRWADRIEAVGKEGVVRCYRFNQERGLPLSSEHSPRPSTVEEIWQYATPERFHAYQSNGGKSMDMISHYYDKLLHIAYPPTHIVQNPYLENKLRDSVTELYEVCLRFGRTGSVDEDYIKRLERLESSEQS